MQTAWMKTRQTKYTLYVTLYLVVIIAVLGAANWLASRHNKSIDSTANKKFSLSDQTVKIVKELKNDVTISDYDRTEKFTAARDLLDRYSALSTKLHVAYIDPDKKPQLAKAAGISKYGTMIVDSGPKKEEAKSLTEEELTSAIIRAIKTGARTACFVTGSGEKSPEDTDERDGYSNVKDSLEKSNYKTKTTSLGAATPADAKMAAKIQPLGSAPPSGGKPEVPSDCTVLIVAGPKYAYQQAAVDAIKTYVDNGGRVLLMLDPPLKMGKSETQESESLDKLLDSWGVTMDKDLVIDLSGVGQIFGVGAEVPLALNYESHPIVRDFKRIATGFPLTRSLEIKSGGSAEKLFSTSDNSIATTNLSSPEVRLDPQKDKKGPLALAAAGTVKSGGKEGRFVVVGSSGWASNSFFGFRGNRDLYLNMMNWLSSDEDLISIRPKDPEDRRLSLSQRQMGTIFMSSVIGLPLIVVVAGLMVWWKRR
jgi:ABC-type uncharacterized transport system involved in gliding motility auxiliary subunit